MKVRARQIVIPNKAPGKAAKAGTHGFSHVYNHCGITTRLPPSDETTHLKRPEPTLLLSLESVEMGQSGEFKPPPTAPKTTYTLKLNGLAAAPVTPIVVQR